MKFLKWLSIVLIVIIALFFIIPLFLPSSFHIERSTIIEKPVNIVFQTAIDMNQRAKWDPWLEVDPEATINITMKQEIIGSGYSWNGEIIGEGKITIQEFVPDKLIKSEIEFIAPQSMKADISWDFENIGKATKSTWSFEGTLSYPFEKWVGIFMDKSMGPQFEKGLSNFKLLVETLPDLAGRTGEINESQFEGLFVITIKEDCPTNKIISKMMEIFPVLMSYLKQNNLEMSGSPFSIYHPSLKEGYVILECGLPVNKKIEGYKNIVFKELP